MPAGGYTTVTIPKWLVQRIKAIITNEESAHHNETLSGFFVKAATEELSREEKRLFRFEDVARRYGASESSERVSQ